MTVEKFKQLGSKTSEKKSFGRGDLSIEKREGDKCVYHVVFRSTIGKTLFSGLIFTQSLHKRIELKVDKNYLKIRLLSTTKDPTTQQFPRQDCEVSFSRVEDLRKFEEEFDKSVSAIKKPA